MSIVLSKGRHTFTCLHIHIQCGISIRGGVRTGQDSGPGVLTNFIFVWCGALLTWPAWLFELEGDRQ